jgi:hypothetical protein
MARDLLYIAIAGVSIKYAFNYIQDIYNYRHGQIKPETL